jgi:hypothetical protein
VWLWQGDRASFFLQVAETMKNIQRCAIVMIQMHYLFAIPVFAITVDRTNKFHQKNEREAPAFRHGVHDGLLHSVETDFRSLDRGLNPRRTSG